MSRTNNKKQKDSIYKCSAELEEKGYLYDNDGLYYQIADEYWVKMNRTDKKYATSIVERKNSSFIHVSPTYTCKEPITENKDSRTKKLKEYWSNINNTTDIEPILSTIAIDLMNEDDFSQLNETFDVYEEMEKVKSIPSDNTIEEEIEKRRNPKLTNHGQKQAQKIEKELKNTGFIVFLNSLLDDIHIGSHINIIRKLLGAFKVMKGGGSYLFETVARAGEGKSYENDIVFGLIIPQQYIYKVNSITIASFIRYSDKNEYYFDRMILDFGDLGGKWSYNNMEEIFNVLKVLITENEYVRDLSEKIEDGNYSNKQLKLKCNSIGGVYSSVINDFTDGDSQLESRTINSTPTGAKDKEVMEFMMFLEYENSPQSKKKKKAELELKKFRTYLTYCLTMDLTIINPYGEIFIKHSLHSDVPKRELKQVSELFDAYCKLTYYDCKNIDGHLVASAKQLEEFMQNICLENALIPYESDFLKMIIGKNTNNELIIINTDNAEETDNENNTNPLNEYYNAVLESIDDIKATSFSDLKSYEEDQAVKRLLKLYKLGGTSTDHKENVFFRISDIRRHYSRYKAYKNIDNVQNLIHRLVKKGYIDSIEYQDGKQSIYYLTEQCKNITASFKLEDEHKESAEEFLKEIGVIDE